MTDHDPIFDSPAYYTAMQDHHDEIREEEASPTLMPIEQIAYRYLQANAQHQNTHVEGEQCDACAQHARALHSQIATVVAVVVREETASDLGMLADYHEGLSADWLDGVATARKIVTEKANEERDYIDPENLSLMGWDEAEQNSKPCGSAYLVREGLTVWCGNGQSCDGNHRAYTGEAEWTEQSSTAEYLCPRCENWGQWTDGQSKATGEDVDEYWCQKCSTESPLSSCSKRLRQPTATPEVSR